MRTNRTPRTASAPAALATVLVLLLALPAMSVAAPGDGYGGGSGGGGHPDDTTGSVYADLVITLRDQHGAPILEAYEVPADEDSEATTAYCVQPVSYDPVPGLPSQVNPVDGRQVWVLPLQGEWIDTPPDPLPVAEIEACDPWPQYAMYVSEVELERLNLSRTDDGVIAQKLADVEEKLLLADRVSLGSTGRIRLDDKEIDASPENQAIYEALMLTGTIPGLSASDTTVAGPPAAIGPVAAEGANSRFDAWELAAMTIGAAASKGTPLTIDAVEYYNRIIGFPPPTDPSYVSPWFAVGGPSFVRSTDPDDPTVELASSERFVDYSGFTYNRSHTFRGSVTWLDVPSLQWKVSSIADVVPFTNLSGLDEIGNQTLTGVVAFAQLADDVRALSNYVPDNTFIPGFFMDVPGEDTTSDQWAAITEPAVDLGTLPESVFQTFPFPVTLSLLNPWGGTDLYTGDHWGGSLIEDARLRITVDDPDEDFTGIDVSATSVATETDPSWDVPFTLVGGDLVGWWGPAEGFPVPPGYNRSTTFDVIVTDQAPTGEYQVTLELVTAGDPTTVLAAERGSITVVANVPTVLWGAPLPKLATQSSVMEIPLQVYAPAAGSAVLDLAIAGPGDDPRTVEDESLAAGDVTVHGTDGSRVVPLPLGLEGQDLVGTWSMAVVPGFNPMTWFVTVTDGAPVGSYSFDVTLQGGNALDTLVVAVGAPPTHGEQPSGFAIQVTPVGTPDTDAAFTFEVVDGDAAGVIFQCKLEKDGEYWLEHGDEPPTTDEEEWKPCISPKEYTDLPAGGYEFFARGRRGEVLSPVVSVTWTATDSGTGTDTGTGTGGGGGGGTGPGDDTGVDPEVRHFGDLTGNVHADSIEALAAAGITRGCNPEGNRYCPRDPVTRGQMAAFLVRTLDLPASDLDAFVDDDGSVFEADINALAAAGITRGTDPDGIVFRGSDVVTRGQMAAFLRRAFSYADAAADHFVDDQGSPFEADINAIAEAGVTLGVNPPANDRYAPDRPVARDEMASFLARALGLGS